MANRQIDLKVKGLTCTRLSWQNNVMKLTTDRHKSEHPIFYRFRFRAATELRGLSIDGMARTCEISTRHFWYIITGERRPSSGLLKQIRKLLGRAGWLFATGQTDALLDTKPRR